MKIRKHKSRQVLYVLARFEEYKMAEFVAGAVYATKRISKGDERKQSFYLLVQPSGVAYLFRAGKEIGMVYPAGTDGWSDPAFNFRRLEQIFPLPVVTE